VPLRRTVSQELCGTGGEGGIYLIVTPGTDRAGADWAHESIVRQALN
jgi:hypothetical protein